MQHHPIVSLLEKSPEFILKSLPEEAVDEWVEAAVGKGRQPDGVGRQWVILPQRAAVRVTPEKVNARERVLWQPAEKEDQYSG